MRIVLSLNYTRAIAAVAFWVLAGFSLPADPIDRLALVHRHNPVIRKADPLEPLSVGNGAFAFSVDVTGLQTFPEFYEQGIPLCTESYWGWHTSPNPENYQLESAMVEFETYGRKVKYPTNLKAPGSEWLRSNPHRLGLGQVGLVLLRTDGSPAGLGDLNDIEQTLDLWSGLVTSRFTIGGSPVQVRTCCHPDLDLIAVRIESPLVASQRLGIRIRFPYGSNRFGKDPADWDHPGLHQTTLTHGSDGRVDFQRRLDADRYCVALVSPDGAKLEQTGPHQYALLPETGGSNLECVVAFSHTPLPAALPSARQCEAASAKHWKRFWSRGAAVDFSGSTDPRARELERRVVLSQYLLAIQSAGPLPPPETGLTCNSWYGKPHLECHWLQGAQFALWGRLELLERSLPWYQSILPAARRTAQFQGYAGVRWPKMVGPDGREGPSPIAPLLIWQQPHPIYYAELCYRAHPGRATLERYKDIVFQSAEFMVSYAVWDKEGERYVLGPPVMPAQENYNARITRNPTFELAYWQLGLETAQKWRERLGLPRDAKWDRVLQHLSQLPLKDGLYLAAESVPDTWTNPKVWRDHPSMLAACGMLPGSGVDREAMRRTLHAVMEKWIWESCWGWDCPLVAMTAARVGEPSLAVDVLMMKTPRNRYLLNGHNFLHNGLPVYLTGNGSLLAAVAMMAGGWDGAPARNAPGFPEDAGWSVQSEGLKPMP